MTELINDVPGCCRLAIVARFEPGHSHDTNELSDKIQNRIRNDIIKRINDCIEDSRWFDKYDGEWVDDCPAIFLASTTDIQVNAEVVLKELGFKRNNKAKVPGAKHKLTLWSITTTAWERRKNQPVKLESLPKLFKGAK